MPIYGTRRTREILLEQRDSLVAELKPEPLGAYVRELEGWLAKATTEEARREVELLLQMHRALLAVPDPLPRSTTIRTSP